MNSILTELLTGVVLPLAGTVISIVSTIYVPILIQKVVAKMNAATEAQKLEIAEKLKQALHQASANGLKVAMTRIGGTAVTKAAVEQALDYVKTKNPETVTKLGVSDKDIRDIIISKVRDLK